MILRHASSILKATYAGEINLLGSVEVNEFDLNHFNDLEIEFAFKSINNDMIFSLQAFDPHRLESLFFLKSGEQAAYEIHALNIINYPNLLAIQIGDDFDKKEVAEFRYEHGQAFLNIGSNNINFMLLSEEETKHFLTNLLGSNIACARLPENRIVLNAFRIDKQNYILLSNNRMGNEDIESFRIFLGPLDKLREIEITKVYCAGRKNDILIKTKEGDLEMPLLSSKTWQGQVIENVKLQNISEIIGTKYPRVQNTIPSF